MTGAVFTDMTETGIGGANITINDADRAGIGTDDNPFKGHLNGNGHIVTLAGATGTGIFTKTEGAEIKNINVTIATDIGGDSSNVGGLIGEARGTTVIDNCTVTLDANGKITGASGAGRSCRFCCDRQQYRHQLPHR